MACSECGHFGRIPFGCQGLWLVMWESKINWRVQYKTGLQGECCKIMRSRNLTKHHKRAVSTTQGWRAHSILLFFIYILFLYGSIILNVHMIPSIPVVAVWNKYFDNLRSLLGTNFHLKALGMVLEVLHWLQYIYCRFQKNIQASQLTCTIWISILEGPMELHTCVL